jgi:two-component system, sensor histidine kinase LadS
MLLLSIKIMAQPVMDLAKTTNLDLKQNRLYYEDKTGKLGFEQIQSPEIDKKFISSEQDVLNFGFSPSNIWVKIQLKNTNLTKDEYISLVNHATLDVVDFYFWQPKSQNYLQIYSGDRKPFTERKVKNRKFVFPLHFADTSTHTLYLRIANQTTIFVPVTIMDKADYDVMSLQNEIGCGIFYGILLIMFFYNLFIFLSLRDVNYLFYILTISGSLLTFASVAGHQSQYLAPENPLFANQLLTFGAITLMTGSLLFSIHFLNVKKYSLWLNYILWLLVGFGIIMLILAIVLPNLYGKLISWTNLLVIVVSITVLVTSIYCFRKGNKAARFYILAFSFYILGLVILSTRNMGVMPVNLFTANSGEIGSILEILFLSLALGDRYNLYKKEKESTQKEMLALQKAANVTLEQKVAERTLQLQDTNNQLNNKNAELLTLNEEINQQHKEIHKQKENIVASINYAQKIQTAMLPFEERIAESLQNFFIFYKPRDIVSGDFYFFEDKETHLIFAALDCTGHGVPGAFMSMIGHEILGEIVNVKHIYSPDLILNELHKGIRVALQQEKSKNRDGMDVAMVSLKKDFTEITNSNDDKNVWNKKFAYLEYAGAMNPFYYVQNNVLTEIKATKKAIGGSQTETLRTFDKHRVEITNTKTIFWLCSDGYQDQFGGIDNRKFMVKPFRELLFSVHHLPVQEQKIALETNFDTWKGSKEQVDDVLLIGVEI